jgi:structural maintenance of chromosome 3 (chondroitin sulfate proteoglycan 6)
MCEIEQNNSPPFLLLFFFFSSSFLLIIYHFRFNSFLTVHFSSSSTTLQQKGAGQRENRAYVEIVFSNNERRLPYDLENVVLRRQIGRDKDMFFINKKHVPKTEVQNMLESAGFSRSNPYYIVQQGKVKALAVMTPADRLRLLKDIAGVKVYEERRKESVKLYTDASKQQLQINDCHEQIDDRLTQLEEEKEELSAYQNLDKQRRALEYTLYNKELQFARSTLDDIDDKRNNEALSSDEMHGIVTATSAKTKELESMISRAEEQLTHLTEERNDVERTRNVLRTEVAQCQLEVDDTKTQLKDLMTFHGDMKDEKLILQKTIARLRNDLDGANGLREKYMHEQELLNKNKKEHEHVEQKIRYLQDIESRASKFSTKKKRDDFLKNNINELNASLQSATLTSTDIQTDIANLENNILPTLEARIQTATTNGENVINDLSKLTDELILIKRRRNKATEERKLLWSQQAKLSEDLNIIIENIQTNKRLMRSTMSPSLSSGVNMIERLQNEINGVHGPVIGLFNPSNEAYYTAIETVAGNRLYHIVVDNENVAQKCMNVLEREKAGRVTFIPLNRKFYYYCF